MGVLKEAVGQFVQGVSEPPVYVKSALCVHTRFIRSECNICVELCPRNAIIKEKGKISVNKDCDGCGACISVCPNGVFGFSHDESTLSKIKAHECKDTIVFACRKTDSGLQSPEIIKLNCISALTLPDILYSSLKAKKLIVAIDKCSNCESRKAMKNFRNILFAGRKLLSMINRDNINVISSQQISNYIDEDGKRDIDIERRSFFKIIANKTISGISSNQTIIEPDYKRRESLNFTRKALLEFLKEYREQMTGEIPEAIPTGEISIDKSKCFGCNVCEHVCPGGAIRRVEESDMLSIMFNPTWCTACGACVSACLTGAVTLKKGLSLEKFLDNQDRLLIKLSQNICRECGMDFFAISQDALCPRCKNGVIQEVKL